MDLANSAGFDCKELPLRERWRKASYVASYRELIPRAKELRKCNRQEKNLWSGFLNSCRFAFKAEILTFVAVHVMNANWLSPPRHRICEEAGIARDKSRSAILEKQWTQSKSVFQLEVDRNFPRGMHYKRRAFKDRSGIMPRPVSYDYNKRTGILSGAQRKREGESNLANQEQKSICREIGARTGGDIYIGVVGPVRSGKSTFIKRFMEQLVLPAIGPAAARERARDELPQSAAGRTIMTTEPKFIPEAAVPLQLEGGGECRVRLIDCVGYMVEGAMGHEENDKPRMVKSPWFDHEVPFDLAAETGTRKVICEHSTIGIVVTTDGSVSDIPREGYARTEKRIVEELNALGKPYIILLNSTHPDAPETKQLAEGMARDYDHTVLPVSCVDLDAEALGSILRQVLYEFPVQELDFALPRWVTMLENGHWLQTQVYDAAMQLAAKVSRMKDVPSGTDAPALECDAVQRSAISGIDLANGSVRITVELKPEIFYQVLSEQTGLAIGDEAGLMPCIMELAKAKREYEKVRSALEQVEATGYGIVMPTVSELKLEQPQIVRQGTNYGVRLEACAPSIQMMKATIHTEISPIVGTEKQSEDLARSLLAGFEDDPEKLWESNIFGKSLHELVNEGLQNKLLHMPQEARTRLQETLERVINEGCTGLICILI